jgi:autotransporter family porin
MKLAGARVRTWCLGISVVLLIGAVTGIAITHYASASSGVYFSTLPPGAALPSGAECASLVRASPSPENRPADKGFNATVGTSVGPGIFPLGDRPQVRALASRINGDFTGTTEDILRWAACKWGIDQDIVFAQAGVESWWDQRQLGDWQSHPSGCAPGHGLGVDGRPGLCPESFGILQNKYIYLKPAWPALSTSTAMNVDVAYAIWRSCYNGDELWLNNQPRGKQYSAGDVWGCVGRWYAGNWHTAGANRYIASVKTYMTERIWEQPSFTARQSQP